MAGNVDNPRIWEGADFYTAPVGTALPDFGSPLADSDWDGVGLLSEDGSTESREDDTQDHYAWGGILVRSTKSRHKRQIVVTMLEDNLTVFGILNPGSETATEDGVNHRTVRVPRSDPRAFLMELRDGDITRRRHIPRGEVESVGEVTLSDSAMTAFEVTITVYPSADGVLYHDYDNDPQNDQGSDDDDDNGDVDAFVTESV